MKKTTPTGRTVVSLQEDPHLKEARLDHLRARSITPSELKRVPDEDEDRDWAVLRGLADVREAVEARNARRQAGGGGADPDEDTLKVPSWPGRLLARSLVVGRVPVPGRGGFGSGFRGRR